ncbi:hypothetical protein, partial [Streptomyces sp. NPDC059651]|uniref:hypothetical protein n=1 Tax=Streptomyces sp. NPDC059651 TaxID=3346897 RepID=UPI00368C1840
LVQDGGPRGRRDSGSAARTFLLGKEPEAVAQREKTFERRGLVDTASRSAEASASRKEQRMKEQRMKEPPPGPSP